MDKSKLILQSLDIKGFRAFRHLQIERLGRVNLFVGKNSVGKTAVLEALLVYAQKGHPSALFQVLSNRNELVLESSREQSANYSFEDLKHLFYAWPEIGSDLSQHQFTISSLDASEYPFDDVEVALKWREKRDNQWIESEDRAELEIGELGFYIENKLGRITAPIKFQQLPPAFDIRIPCVFVPSNGIPLEQMNIYWDNISLTDLDIAVTEAARIIDDKIDRINFISKGQPLANAAQVPYAKVGKHRVPLQSLGEGANRIFGLALALANAESGFLLVDEIESGLHFSIQHRMWELIFQLAQKLNVQVFATTHSDDCVAAFQAVAERSEEIDGELIRLEAWNGIHKAILFDEKRLDFAIREGIDVR